MRLAQLYLDMADDAYRLARDDVAAFGAAKRLYERIVRTGGTLDAESPLYRDAKFASIKARVTGFLAAADKLAFADNPAITAKVLEANAKLDQIAAGLEPWGGVRQVWAAGSPDSRHAVDTTATAASMARPRPHTSGTNR